MKIFRPKYVLFILLILGVGSTFLDFSLGVAGKVLDKQSGEPIEDAIIVVKWRSETGLVTTRSLCSHSSIAISDSRGKFMVYPWVAWAAAIPQFNSHYTFHAYKWGYEFSNGEVDSNIELAPETEYSEMRKIAEFASKNIFCSGYDDKNIIDRVANQVAIDINNPSNFK